MEGLQRQKYSRRVAAAAGNPHCCHHCLLRGLCQTSWQTTCARPARRSWGRSRPQGPTLHERFVLAGRGDPAWAPGAPLARRAQAPLRTPSADAHGQTPACPATQRRSIRILSRGAAQAAHSLLKAAEMLCAFRHSSHLAGILGENIWQKMCLLTVILGNACKRLTLGARALRPPLSSGLAPGLRLGALLL